jgi:hypothetical protein
MCRSLPSHVTAASFRGLRLIEIAPGKLLEFFEMLWVERLTDAVVFIEPTAEIDDLATARAEWPHRSCKKRVFLSADWTLNQRCFGHQMIKEAVVRPPGSGLHRFGLP